MLRRIHFGTVFLNDKYGFIIDQKYYTNKKERNETITRWLKNHVGRYISIYPDEIDAQKRRPPQPFKPSVKMPKEIFKRPKAVYDNKQWNNSLT